MVSASFAFSVWFVPVTAASMIQCLTLSFLPIHPTYVLDHSDLVSFCCSSLWIELDDLCAGFGFWVWFCVDFSIFIIKFKAFLCLVTRLEFQFLVDFLWLSCLPSLIDFVCCFNYLQSVVCCLESCFFVSLISWVPCFLALSCWTIDLLVFDFCCSTFKQ